MSTHCGSKPQAVIRSSGISGSSRGVGKHILSQQRCAQCSYVLAFIFDGIIHSVLLLGLHCLILFFLRLLCARESQELARHLVKTCGNLQQSSTNGFCLLCILGRRSSAGSILRCFEGVRRGFAKRTAVRSSSSCPSISGASLAWPLRSCMRRLEHECFRFSFCLQGRLAKEQDITRNYCRQVRSK